MDEQINRKINKQINRQIDKQINRKINKLRADFRERGFYSFFHTQKDKKVVKDKKINKNRKASDLKINFFYLKNVAHFYY